MSTNRKLRKALHAGISTIALLTHLAQPVLAQEVVQNNTNSGLSFGDISGFNNPGYTITNYGGDNGVETGNVTGDFINSGYISADTYGVLIDGDLTGNFTNLGSIIGGDYGVYIVGNMVGNFTNSGIITGSESYGVNFNGELTGDFLNTKSGTITGGVYYGVNFDDALNGNFVNHGNISGKYYGVSISNDFNGNFLNTGTISSDLNTDQDAYGVAVYGNMVGNFTNEGTIKGGYFGVLINDNFTGDFNNSGSISGSTYGVAFWDNVTGDFTNSGSITSSEEYAVWFYENVTGNFVNSKGGTIDGGYYGVFYTENLNGDFTNHGTIIGREEYGVFIGGELSGNFTNSGSITGDEFGVNFNDDVTGNFLNTGDIIATDEYGVYIDEDFTGNFTNEGNITGDTHGVYVGSDFNGTFRNTGNITGLETYGVLIWGDVEGDFINTGNISGGEFGVVVDGNFVGDFVNHGNITGTDEYGVWLNGEVNGNFTNTGNISANNGTYGVAITGNFTGDFNNSGNVTGGQAGVMFYENVTGNFDNTGNITGGYYGVYVLENIEGNFTNSGRIVGTESYGILMYGEFTGDFTNTGTIMGDSYAAILIDGNFTGDFENKGDILAFGNEGYGILIWNNFTGDFTNSGNITGNYYGAYIYGNMSGNFTNTGTIAALSGSYGVDINGDLNGDFVNKGYILGPDADGLNSIVGNFTGNLTTPINQGLRAVGTADISGKTVTAYVDGFYKDGTTWTALQAATLTSDGSGSQDVQDTSALLDVSIDTLDGTDLILQVNANEITEVVGSGQAPGLGLLGLSSQFINTLENDGALTVEERKLVDYLYQQGSSGGVAKVLADYSPSGNRGSLAGSYATNQLFMDTLVSRLGSIGGGSQSFGVAMPNNSGGNSASGTYGYGGAASYTSGWVQAFGGTADADSNGAIASVDTSTAGAAFGGEINNGSGFLAGVAFAYGRSSFDGDAASGDVNSYMPAIYGRYQPNVPWYISGILAGSWSEVSQDRYNHTAGETLTADYNTSQVAARGEIGYDFGGAMGTFTPFVAGTFGQYNSDSYQESGGATALSVGSGSDPYHLLEVGARFAYTQEAMSLVGVVGWREDFDSVDTSISARLANSTAFDTTYDINVGGAFAGVKATIGLASDMELSGSVGGVFGGDYSSVGGSLKISKKF